MVDRKGLGWWSVGLSVSQSVSWTLIRFMLQATACVRLPATRSPVWPIHFFANQGILMFPSSGSFYTRRLAGSRSSSFLAMFRCRLLSLESSLDSSMHNRKLMLLASASACCDLRFTIRHADWPLCPHIIRSNILEAFVFFYQQEI